MPPHDEAPPAAAAVTLELQVNGTRHEVRTHAMARLLDVLREDLGLTGSKEGCGEGECGACSVFIDGVLVNACLVPVLQAVGHDVQTVEGLADRERLDPIQAAFIDSGGAQCGICTPGMIVATAALLRKNADPDEAAIRDGLAGNLCRCTGYTRIIESVRDAVRRRQDSGDAR